MEPQDAPNAPGAPDAAPGRSALRILGEIAGILITLGAIGAAIFFSYNWLTNPPKARRRPPARKATLVAVEKVRSASRPVVIRVMGTVVPARTVVLAPRVAGEIVSLSPELTPGGRFAKGDRVAVIDKTDFELAVTERQWEIRRREAEQVQLGFQIAQRKSDVSRADASLRLEKAKGELAQKEFDLSGQTLSEEDRDLVLRGPQRASAEAACASARAAQKAVETSLAASEASLAGARTALEKARIQLERTKVTAPFNAVVTVKSTELGAQVSSGKGLATLVGTDEFWIELSVPVTDLIWIAFPDRAGGKGAEVRISHEAAWGRDARRTGRVLRLLPQLEPAGRMARILVSVRDPLALSKENRGQPPLILGAYVTAVIQGTVLKDVVAVPRTAVRDGDRAWVMTDQNTLEIRSLHILWQNRRTVFARSGLNPGDRLITSDLGAPVAGMQLRLKGQGRPPGDRGAPGDRPGGQRPPKPQ